MKADWAERGRGVGNYAQYYDQIVDRQGPLLAAAVGRCLTGIWAPMEGPLKRRSELAWATRSPVVFDFDFEGLLLEFEWRVESRSVNRADVDTDTLAGRHGDPEGWYRLGDVPGDSAGVAALVGRRLWAVDVLEVDSSQCDLGFAFDSGYLTMTATCCCDTVLSCGPNHHRRLRLAKATPTSGGYPPQGVVAPRKLPAWPPFHADPYEGVGARRPEYPDSMMRFVVST